MAIQVSVFPNSAATSRWVLLRGLWESALRLEEAMQLAWDVPGAIIPEWPRGKWPILRIPAERQKNATEEAIPMLPGLDDLLQTVADADRCGWVFNPLPLGSDKPAADRRLTTEWVGRVIGRIGEAAGVVVEPARGTPPVPPESKAGEKRKRKKRRGPTRTATYTPPKFASAHDLRRSCTEALVNRGVPPVTIQAVARHASFQTTQRYYAPGNVQAHARKLREAGGSQTGYTPVGTSPIVEQSTCKISQ